MNSQGVLCLDFMCEIAINLDNWGKWIWDVSRSENGVVAALSCRSLYVMIKPSFLFRVSAVRHPWHGSGPRMEAHSRARVLQEI